LPATLQPLKLAKNKHIFRILKIFECIIEQVGSKKLSLLLKIQK